MALRVRRGSTYRCLLRFGLAFGHAILFCEVDTAVPWRMVRRASGCKDVFDLLLLPRVPLARKGHAASVSGKAANGCAVATRCPGGRRGRCPHRPVAEAFINHRASGSEKRSWMDPRLPRAKGFPKDGAFPSLTAAWNRQPSAGGRRSAPAQTDPPKHFFSLDRAIAQPLAALPLTDAAYPLQVKRNARKEEPVEHW